jgi:phosphohistidine phosphatase
MQLYFLRHGIAVDHGTPGYENNDDARPLTDKGIRVTQRVARALQTLVKPDVILSSPLPRAQQTADIVGASFKVRVVVTDDLGLSFNAHRLADALKMGMETIGTLQLNKVILVGHEPSMSATIAALVGSDLELVLKKTGLARVDVEDLQLTGGRLRWLLTPGHLRRMG